MNEDVIGAEDPDFMRYYGRHCVALTCYQSIPDAADFSGGPRDVYVVFSGFVLSVQDEWFLVTAGHWFTEMQEAEVKGCVFHDWQLKDLKPQWSGSIMDIDAPTLPLDTIPFAYQNAFKTSWYDAVTGEDWAFVHLRSPYYRRLLEANGVEALAESAWKIGVPTDFGKCVLIGNPADLTLNLPTPGLISSYLVSLDVEPIDSPDNLPHLFHARIPDITRAGLKSFTSVKGMSGGPILGFARDEEGKVRYWLVALQSTCDASKAMITGFRVRQLGEYLELVVTKVRDAIIHEAHSLNLHSALAEHEKSSQRNMRFFECL